MKGASSGSAAMISLSLGVRSISEAVPSSPEVRKRTIWLLAEIAP
jgi:hypothetical protein